MHLVCGIWGTMIVPATHGMAIVPNEAGDPNFLGQFVGVALTAVFVSAASLVVWLALKFTIGVRATEEEEMMGMDKAEVGLEALSGLHRRLSLNPILIGPGRFACRGFSFQGAPQPEPLILHMAALGTSAGNMEGVNRLARCKPIRIRLTDAMRVPCP
ncbi:MAG: hypothetical protein R3C04_04115 [Hyphomonas sp.]